MSYGARQVPQNIMSVEFKIFDIMTLKQFGISVALLIVCIGIFSLFSSPWNIIIPIFIIIVGGIVIFVPFNGEPFQEFLSSYIEAMISPQRRIWHKKGIVLKSAAEKARYYYGRSDSEKMNNFIFNDKSDHKTPEQKKLDKEEELFLKSNKQEVYYKPPVKYRNMNQNIESSGTNVSQKSLENTADLSSIVKKSDQLNRDLASTMQRVSVDAKANPQPYILKKENNSQSNAAFKPQLGSEQEEIAVRNFIFGSVEGYDGKPVKGAAVILKNIEGETLEVFYTNSAGEFKSNYEYVAGKYQIYVNVDSKDFNEVVITHNPIDPNPVLILPKDYKQNDFQREENTETAGNSDEDVFAGDYDPKMFSIGQEYIEENNQVEKTSAFDSHYIQSHENKIDYSENETNITNPIGKFLSTNSSSSDMRDQTSGYSRDALDLFEQMNNNRLINDYGVSQSSFASNNNQQSSVNRAKVINDVEILEFEKMPNALVPFEQNLVSLPNTVNGILVDPHGYGLAGALIRIFDKNGELITSMNSDNTGRFYTYSPLPNNDYIVYVSKNNQNLVGFTVSLNGSVIPPKIISFTY